MNNNLIRTILERELESKNLIYPFIAGLTGREQKVLEMRSEIPPKTLQQIGDALELTRQRTAQVEIKAHTKIKFQKEVIQTLANKLGEYLFSEGEVEQAFLDYWKVGTVAEKKLQWQDFNKNLWKIKQKKELRH